MSKTLVDVDDDLLTRAMSVLGTGTKKDTVNGALREIVAQAARRRYLDRARAGEFSEMADPEFRAAAWR